MSVNTWRKKNHFKKPVWQNVLCWTDKWLSKDIDIYAKHGSKEDIAKLNAVSKAFKASSMKALRDFQRR